MTLYNDLPEELKAFFEPLTWRQRQVLELAVMEGLSYKQIASRLDISWYTVKKHMVAIYDKLCPHRRELILAALEAWRRGELNLFEKERNE